MVAPRSGGPIDVVDATVAGYLYTPGDATDLASYVDLLAGDAAARRAMALAARRSVEGRSWASVNDALVGHYREVVTARRGQGLRSVG